MKELVYIEWVDSFGCSPDWAEIVPDMKPELLVCKSVGWLFYDGPDCKVIVPHITSEGHSQTAQQGCGDMTIPSKAVLKIVPLEINNTEGGRAA